MVSRIKQLNCYLKLGESSNVIVYNFSFLMSHSNLASHFYDNKEDYPGNDLTYFTGIETTFDCMQVCLNFKSCSYFTYRYASKDCFLKYGMVRAGNLNLISGPSMEILYQGTLIFLA